MSAIRKIPAFKIYEVARRLARDMNLHLSDDILDALKRALKLEEKSHRRSPARKIIQTIIENSHLAERKCLPLCQDTGFVEGYLAIGSEVVVIRGEKLSRDFSCASSALASGIRDGYIENKFRFSMVSDPLLRKNTSDNTPPFIYCEEVPNSKKITIGIIAKGGGSENSSAINFFSPSTEWKEIEDFVLETVRLKAPYACPPVIVSVALGGNFSAAPMAAKKVFLLRKIGSRHPSAEYDRREKNLLKKINSLGIGPMGLGGKTTALGVFITPLPTHIAMLPCAIAIQCHSIRRAVAVL